jgi:hypothetical protein
MFFGAVHCLYQSKRLPLSAALSPVRKSIEGHTNASVNDVVSRVLLCSGTGNTEVLSETEIQRAHEVLIETQENVHLVLGILAVSCSPESSDESIGFLVVDGHDNADGGELRRGFKFLETAAVSNKVINGSSDRQDDNRRQSKFVYWPFIAQ